MAVEFSNVVTHQPGPLGSPIVQPAPQNQRHWSTGLCDCFSDIGTCVFGTFCGWCLMCRVAERLEEHCCTTCHAASQVALRTKLRTMYGITGSVCNDCMVMACFGPCAVCQMDREIKILQGRE